MKGETLLRERDTSKGERHYKGRETLAGERTRK